MEDKHIAIGTIPSWLELPNFIQAMREGAATGLAARRQDSDEAQAADRMQLAYEQLAEKERAANELAQNRQAMEEDRQQRAADALAQRTQAALALQQYRQDQANKPDIHFGPQGEVLSADPSGNVKVLRGRDQAPAPLESVTETYKIPAVEGVEGKPAYKGLFGTGLFAHPAIPAVAAQPERTITKRVKGSAADALLDSAPEPAVPTKKDNSELAARAHAAIAAGADGEAVKARYKKLTGEDLE